MLGPQKFRRSLKWPPGFMTLKHKLAFSSKARVALRLLLRSRLRQSTSNRLKLVFTDPQCKYWSNHLKKSTTISFPFACHLTIARNLLLLQNRLYRDCDSIWKLCTDAHFRARISVMSMAEVAGSNFLFAECLLLALSDIDHRINNARFFSTARNCFHVFKQ